MIFQTQNQLNSLMIFSFAGIVIGLFSIIYFLFFTVIFQKKLIKNIIIAVFYAFFSIIFVILINLFNFGTFSLSLLASFISGLLLIRFSLKNLVVILEKKWYTKINNIFKKLKSNIKRKPKTNDTSKES